MPKLRASPSSIPTNHRVKGIPMSQFIVLILIAGVLASSSLAALSGFLLKDRDESEIEIFFVIGPFAVSALLSFGLIILGVLSERSGIL
jgi:hypothetical protein